MIVMKRIQRKRSRQNSIVLRYFPNCDSTNNKLLTFQSQQVGMSDQPQLADPMGLAQREGRGTNSNQLSPEERRVMESCTNEAFWYRSIPIGAFLASFVHLGVQRGFIRPSLNYGSSPKVVLGGIVGYFLGKASYVNVCADKFLVEAPDSHIADAVRFNRGLPTRNPNFEQEMKSRAGMVGFGSESDGGGGGSQPQSPIYNNPNSPTYIPPGDHQQQQQQQPPLSGYDELRRRNREGSGVPGFSVPLSPPPPPPPSAEAGPPSKLRPIQPTNKYGDEGFE